MQLIKDQLQRRAYDYCDAQQVTQDDFTWHCFSYDQLYEVIPGHINLGYSFIGIDTEIACLNDYVLSHILIDNETTH